MKKKKLNLKNKIVRGLTYTVLCVCATTTTYMMITTTIEKLFF